MNAHSKNGSRGARSRTPKLSLYYYLSATFRIPWNVCEELRPQNLLKMNGIDCDLLGEVRKRSRAFAISWEKIANDRVHLRSLGRRSQTIACICDLLGGDRKPSRAFAISWEEIANRRGHLRSAGRRSQTDARDSDLTPPQTANCSGSFRRAARHCGTYGCFGWRIRISSRQAKLGRGGFHVSG